MPPWPSGFSVIRPAAAAAAEPARHRARQRRRRAADRDRIAGCRLCSGPSPGRPRASRRRGNGWATASARRAQPGMTRGEHVRVEQHRPDRFRGGAEPAPRPGRASCGRRASPRPCRQRSARGRRAVRRHATSAASFAGVSGRSMASTPSASATALAMQTGVDMQLPSPTPLAPSGVNGEGLSMCRISDVRHLGRGRHQIVGEGAGEEAPSSP